MSRIYLSPPHLSGRERELLLAAVESNWVAPAGPDLEAFEREIAPWSGVSHSVALSSGTAALHLALHVLGVGAGDDVLTASLTFVATANAIAYLGARPVFIDADPETWTIDPELLAAELDQRAREGRLPKAVVTVDLYGHCADYDPILAACRKHQVPVVEDAAEALGATYRGRPAGSFGDLSIFSFNGNKIITTSGGGMLVSDNPEWIERARYLATQAREPAPHYQHSEIGFNYRLSNLLAAIGRGQLEQLQSRVARRREIHAVYREALGDLPGVTFLEEAGYGRSTHWLTCLLLDPEQAGVDSERVRQHLETIDVESRPVWKPMHLQPAYAHCPMRGGAVAERLFRLGLCLPSGSSLTESDLDRVVGGIRECFR